LTALLLPLWAHKLGVLPLLPVGLVLVLLGLGLGTKRRGWFWAGFALLALLSLGVTADALLRPLERAYPFMTAEECPEADAAVVLGGGVVGEVEGERLEWNDASDRFEGGLALLRSGSVRYVVFTRGKISGSAGADDGEMRRSEALRRGVAAEHIVLPGASAGNTEDEADSINRLMESRGWKRVVLVTSAFHMPRSMRLFRRAGIMPVPFPVDYRGRWRLGSDWMDWLPMAEGLKLSEIALKEYVGLAYYSLK